jgi:hypothetical protein
MRVAYVRTVIWKAFAISGVKQERGREISIERHACIPVRMHELHTRCPEDPSAVIPALIPLPDHPMMRDYSLNIRLALALSGLVIRACSVARGISAAAINGRDTLI